MMNMFYRQLTLDEENTDCFLLVASHRTRLSVDEVGEAW